MPQRKSVTMNMINRTWVGIAVAILIVGLIAVAWRYGLFFMPASQSQVKSPYHSVGMPASARYYYQTAWGIDNLVLRVAASGNLIRFSYRVTNVNRAGELGNKRAKPLLIDAKRKVALEIPVMEQVGPLWQTVGLENGKQYWMTFSNKGEPVHVGDRVSVVIGNFHADGLLVE